MTLGSIPPQAKLLYDHKWSPKSDALFLNTIVQLKTDDNWINKDCPLPSALLTARGVVKETFGIRLSCDDISERMKFYRARYDMFKRITNAAETYWDRYRNCVVAHEKVWTKLIEEASFARVYYHQREPEFMNLCKIFGMDNLKTEDGQTVIVISNSTTRINSPEYINIPTSDSEEVNSPMVANSRRRRALFSAPPGADDKMSTNGANNHANGPNIRAFPTRNAFPGPYKPSKNPDFTPSSSCASSSPSTWWKNP